MPPDYAMIIVGANNGINHMTKEHMAICLSFKIPFFIVVTKIDMCPKNILSETMKNMKHDGIKSVIAVGPGKVLQGLFKKIERNINTQSATL